MCGLAAVPLVAALLRQGIPLSAVMAFWLASPVTDPGMLLLTAGFLGWSFALGKLAAATGLGLAAGAVTQAVCGGRQPRSFLRQTAQPEATCNGESSEGWSAFAQEAWATFRLVLRWLLFALALEGLIRGYVDPACLAGMLGRETPWGVPLAVAIASPMYIEGYAAMPVLRGLIDLGLSPGAAMAFLLAGSTISIYSAAAVWAVARPPVFVLYLLLGLVGAIAAGYVTQLVT